MAPRALSGPPPATPTVFDGHNDVAGWLVRHPRVGVRRFLDGGGDAHVDLQRARAGRLAGGMFALFSRDARQGEMAPRDLPGGGWEIPPIPPLDADVARRSVMAMLASLARLERGSGGDVEIVRSTVQLRRAMRAGRLAIVVHLEGAEPIDPELVLLDVLHAAGLRSLGIVWSRPNAFGHGVPFRHPGDPNTGPGLTRLGKRLVRACNERGILVDLAHLNARGVRDVAKLSDVPLVVSHTAAHALAPSARNLTDAQLDTVGASGGLVGVYFSTCDVRADGRDDPDTPLEAVVEHVEHIARRIGIDHVALGSDFDGATVPAALGGAAGLPALLGLLRDRGWSATDLRKLAHGNWLRVLDATWTPG